MHKEKKWNAIKMELLKWKQNLEDENNDVNFEQTSEEGEIVNQETMIILKRKQNEHKKRVLDEIRNALNKIENGNYGICEESGEPIEERRLFANPIARYSIETQKMIEKNKRN